MAISGGSRRAILSVAIGGVAALPGCTASDGPDVAFEYSVSIESEPDVIPEDARDHYGRDGYEWVVVEIAVDEGELDMEDVWFNSRIETEDRYHDLDHASGEIPDGIQSRGAVQEGGEAIAVYQIPEETEVVGWDLSELDQEMKLRNAESCSCSQADRWLMSEIRLINKSAIAHWPEEIVSYCNLFV